MTWFFGDWTLIGMHQNTTNGLSWTWKIRGLRADRVPGRLQNDSEVMQAAFRLPENDKRRREAEEGHRHGR